MRGMTGIDDSGGSACSTRKQLTFSIQNYLNSFL